MMETPEQPNCQRGDCALHNGSSSPTQQPEVQDAPPSADRHVGYPAQESDQHVRGSYLVLGTSELRLRRGYDDQPRCQQQPEVQDAPPSADRHVGYPAQESDQHVRGSYLVLGTSELRLRRGYDDQPRCQQQTNDSQVNCVSSLGENDQAIHQSCTMQELRLWEKEIARQVTNFRITKMLPSQNDLV